MRTAHRFRATMFPQTVQPASLPAPQPMLLFVQAKLGFYTWSLQTRCDSVEDPIPRMPKDWEISYEANRRAKAEMRVCGASGGGVVEIRVCVLEEVG